jgi:hypothetical protein
LEIYSLYTFKSNMAQKSNQNSADAEIITNDVNNPVSRISRGTTAKTDGDEPVESAPKLIGEGTVVSKSFNQSHENDAITSFEEQQALKSFGAQHKETRLSSEKHFEANKLAQRLCRKRQFNEVAGASNVEEPVSKRQRIK